MEISRGIKITTIAASTTAGFIVALWGYVQFFPSFAFHSSIALALTIGCVGPAILFQIEFRRRNSIDENLPRLIEDLAESQETGMTLLQSLEESAKRKYGPLTSELRLLVAQLSWGIEFGEAFKAFAKRAKTETAEKTVVLVLQAIRHGGDLKKIFGSTAAFTRKIIEIRKESKAQLRQYVFTIYTIIIVFQVILVVLFQSLFTTPTQTSRFLISAASPDKLKLVLTDLSTVEAMFAGLIAGKLSEGTMRMGLKHSIVLLLISWFVTTFYL